MYPEDLRYNKEHEWVRRETDGRAIGITHYAQEELGDVVFVDLPRVGQQRCRPAKRLPPWSR